MVPPKARRGGVTGASEAIADIEARGARATVVAAVIRRLAADLTRRTRQDFERAGLLRPPAPVVTLQPSAADVQNAVH